jgi:hypothetical protein
LFPQQGRQERELLEPGQPQALGPELLEQPQQEPLEQHLLRFPLPERRRLCHLQQYYIFSQWVLPFNYIM